MKTSGVSDAISKRLTNSFITPSKYTPSEFVKSSSHVCICSGDNLLLSLGPADDELSIRQAKLLAGDGSFKHLLKSANIFGPLSVKYLSGQKIDWLDSHYALSSKIPGTMEIGGSPGNLLAIFFGAKGLELSSAISVTHELASIFAIDQ